MNDLIRWAAKDVDDCEAGIARAEEWIKHYEWEASKVTFDATAHADMLFWADWHRQSADAGRQRLSVLRHRLEYVGGITSPAKLVEKRSTRSWYAKT